MQLTPFFVLVVLWWWLAVTLIVPKTGSLAPSISASLDEAILLFICNTMSVTTAVRVLRCAWVEFSTY